MDEFIAESIKFLSNTINVRIMSNPAFAIEIFLSWVVCIVHLLLIFEINTLVKRTNAKAAEKLRLKHAPRDGEICSYHSLVTLQTAVFQKKPESLGQNTIFRVPFNGRLQRKISATSNFGWLVSRGDSILKNKFDDRVENLLAISPSEYVRRDKERKSREAGLRSCIQSLTSLLENALNNGNLDLQNMSKDDIKRSINTIRENFESRISDTCKITDFPSPSLQSLISKSTAKNALANSLSPNLLPSSVRTASSLRLSYGGDDEKNHGDSGEEIVLKKSDSLSELFRQASRKFYDGNEKHSRIVLTN